MTMDANRRAALSAGVLFIIATAASVSAATLSQPVLNHSDYLTRVTANANQVTGAALLDLLAAAASAGIAISLYPILKGWNVSLALGSVVFRTVAAVMYIAGLVTLLSLPALGQQFTRAASADRASYQAIGDSLLTVRAGHQAVRGPVHPAVRPAEGSSRRGCGPGQGGG